MNIFSPDVESTLLFLSPTRQLRKTWAFYLFKATKIIKILVHILFPPFLQKIIIEIVVLRQEDLELKASLSY